ncbi:MAG: acyl--CoA ligase [Lachnospiraceae bacterium]|nr:acyl--CoA ligase [Lachnospiraceae bacterium]
MSDLRKKELTGFPSIDKPWLKYYTEEDLKIEVPECTIYQNIYVKNKDYPEDIAIQYYGNKINYRDLFVEVEACAKTLRSIGIKKGDCVNLCTAGVPEAIYVVLSCSRVGAIANFINPLFSTEQIIERVNDTGAEWMLILDAMYGYIKDVLPKTCIKKVVIIPATNSIPHLASKLLYLKSDARTILKNRNIGDQEYLAWKEFREIGSSYKGAVDVPYERDTATVMVYSSGSTGASKGIQLTNDGINAFVVAYQTEGYTDMAYRRGLTFLQMIPIWFSTGIVYSILMPLAKGFTVILEPKFSKECFANDLKKYKPELTLTATSLWLYLVNNELEIDFSKMEYPITGGEKILPQDEKRINEYLKNRGCKKRFYKGYGMCELGSEVSGTTDVANYSDKTGGCGYPMLHVSVSAFNIDTDEELPYSQRGEIRVCSPARMKGYYKNPEATAAFFKTDSQVRVWGCTGDIGYVDEDGELFILGRATDSYRRENGEIVFLFDIENEILKDDAVKQCKVVDTELEGKTVLVGHIVLKTTEADPDDLLKRLDSMLRATLPDYMIPEYYKIRESMPVHTNGKRDVGALKKDKENLKRV